MKRQDYYRLIKDWNAFLIKENVESLNIDSQMQRALDIISKYEDQKLKILLIKDGKEFVLKAELVDSNTKESIDEVAYILFKKFSHRYVKDQEGMERSCYIIEHTEFVKYDLGPLMYDFIIEFASNDESFLCCDRFELSEDAKNVWRKYFSRRHDVKQVQLDIENESLDPEEFPNLTPQVEDDFYQNVSIDDRGKSWSDSPFSKGYYKLDNKVTDFIKNNEMFIYKEIVY